MSSFPPRRGRAAPTHSADTPGHVGVRLLVSLAIVLLAPAAGFAHSNLQDVGTTPGVGLQLSFSGPVEQAFLRVTGRDGVAIRASVDPADDQTVVVPRSTDAGPVHWRVLSRDGHVTVGTSDGTRGTTRQGAISIAADALGFVGLLGLIGLIAVRFLVLAPAWRTGGMRPPGASGIDDWHQVIAPSLERGLAAWWRTWWSFSATAAVGVGLAAVGLLAELDSSDIGALVGTRWGVAWVIQGASLGVIAGLGAHLGRSSLRTEPDLNRAWGYALAIPLGLAAGAIAWTSHASSGTDAAIGIGLDAIHLWATGIWLGGLGALIAIVPLARRQPESSDVTRFSAAVVVRFSTVAIVCVATLIVTGIYRAIAELRGFADLVDTGYGQALLVKLIVFAVLLAGGAYNRLVLHPRLERAALGLSPSDRGAGQALRISMTAEIMVATVLLVIVAVLVNLPPP